MPQRSAKRRRTVARHGRLTSPHPLRHVLAIVGAAVAVVLVSVTGVAGFTLWDSASAISAHAVSLDAPGEPKSPPPPMGAIEGEVNLLLVGTDSCEGQDVSLFPRCRLDDAPGERNDVTMLVHISSAPRRITVVSFPRDMIVSIPSCTAPDGDVYGSATDMMNVSYTHGGLTCTAATVEKMTGFDIKYAAAVRWTGVINISDAVGGVPVCVTGDIYDSQSQLSLSAGTHNLQGLQALQFLRTRHGIGDGSDLGRISNQQQFMTSLVRTLRSSAVLGDPGRLFGLASTVMSQVRSDQLVLSEWLASPASMVQIAMAAKDVPFDDIVFVQYPTYYIPVAGSDASIVKPVTSAADALFAALHANQPIALTGEAGAAGSVDVVGEATDTSAPAPTPTTAPTAAADGTVAAAPAAPAAPAEQRVELPSSITGTTAADVTCANPFRG